MAHDRQHVPVQGDPGRIEARPATRPVPATVLTTMVIVCRGVMPTALNAPRSCTRSLVCRTTVLSTPSPATSAMTSVSVPARPSMARSTAPPRSLGADQIEGCGLSRAGLRATGRQIYRHLRDVRLFAVTGVRRSRRAVPSRAGSAGVILRGWKLITPPGRHRSPGQCEHCRSRSRSRTRPVRKHGRDPGNRVALPGAAGLVQASGMRGLGDGPARGWWSQRRGG